MSGESPQQQQLSMAYVNGDKNRFLFQLNGKTVYEWEQTLDEVILYIPAPPNCKASSLAITIQPRLVTVGLRNEPPFLDEPTFDLVDVRESTWTVEDHCVVIYLHKARKALVWQAALTRFPVQLNPLQLEQVQQTLLKERWQGEHPGMDFRDATFNGSVPDPREFMGGVKYD